MKMPASYKRLQMVLNVLWYAKPEIGFTEEQAARLREAAEIVHEVQGEIRSVWWDAQCAEDRRQREEKEARRLARSAARREAKGAT